MRQGLLQFRRVCLPVGHPLPEIGRARHWISVLHPLQQSALYQFGTAIRDVDVAVLRIICDIADRELERFGAANGFFLVRPESPALDGAEENVEMNTDHDGVRTEEAAKELAYR